MRSAPSLRYSTAKIVTMRTRVGPRTAVDQIRQPTLAGIPAQPLVHRLPRHPEPARHLSHRDAVENFQDRPTPLLGHTQLHQHDPAPLDCDHDDRSEEATTP